MCFRELSFPTSHRLADVALQAAGLIILIWWVTHPAAADGQSPSQARVRWTISDNDCRLRTLQHERLDGSSRAPACDHLRTYADHGTHAYGTTTIQPLAVISELQIRVPIKSTRIGHQLLARVVMPRTTHPETGQPFTVMIPGSSVQSVGTWTNLQLDSLETKLNEQVRVLRSSLPFPIDPREAFLDRVIVNVYGGPGAAEIWLRDPITEGGVPSEQGAAFRQEAIASVSYNSALTGSRRESTVRLDGDVLLIDNRPFFTRAIEYRGEDWQFLKDLGFNTILLPNPPTAAEVAQAEAHDLWLVAAAPNRLSRGDLSAAYRRVISWHLGDGLTSQQIERCAQVAHDIRAADLALRRPIAAGVDTDLDGYSRFANILIHHREPLGSSLTSDGYRDWLAGRSRLAEPGTLHWSIIQSEPLRCVEQQARALGISAADEIVANPLYIRQLTDACIAAGMRGIVFASRQRLDSDSNSARLRAASMRSVNLTLDVIEPWLAAGRIQAAQTSRRDYHAVLNRAPQAWLVHIQPRRSSHGKVTESDAPLDVTLPGVPQAAEAFALTVEGLSTLPRRRVAGGYQLRLDKPRQSRFVVITADTNVAEKLTADLRRTAAELAELERRFATALLSAYRHVAQQIPPGRPTSASSIHRKLDLAEMDLERCAAMFDAGQFWRVRAAASSSLARSVSAGQEMLSDTVNRSTPTTPFAHDPATLIQHWQLTSKLQAANWSDNLLPAGAMPSLTELSSRGWRTFQCTPPGTTAQASLAPIEKNAGQLALTLAATAGEQPATVVANPPIWVQSPEIDVPPQQIVRLAGRIKVPHEIQGSQDGVMVFDSVGGPALAVRTMKTNDWQPFALLRATGNQTTMHITVALTGYGKVAVDDLEIRTLLPARVDDSAAE